MWGTGGSLLFNFVFKLFSSDYYPSSLSSVSSLLFWFGFSFVSLSIWLFNLLVYSSIFCSHILLSFANWKKLLNFPSGLIWSGMTDWSMAT